MSASADLLAYLTGKGHSNIYTNFRPATPHVCIVINDSGGEPTVPGFGVAGAKFNRPHVQILTRGVPKDADTPEAAALSIHASMAEIQAMTVNGTFYHRFTPMQMPFVFERDDNERVVWACNYAGELEP